MSARVEILLTLKHTLALDDDGDHEDQCPYLSDSTSTFLSFLMTEMSESSAPQQLSFLTWFMSLTLVLATIMSSLSFTILTPTFTHKHTGLSFVSTSAMFG